MTQQIDLGQIGQYPGCLIVKPNPDKNTDDDKENSVPLYGMALKALRDYAGLWVLRYHSWKVSLPELIYRRPRTYYSCATTDVLIQANALPRDVHRYYTQPPDRKLIREEMWYLLRSSSKKKIEQFGLEYEDILLNQFERFFDQRKNADLHILLDNIENEVKKNSASFLTDYQNLFIRRNLSPTRPVHFYYLDYVLTCGLVTASIKMISEEADQDWHEFKQTAGFIPIPVSGNDIDYQRQNRTDRTSLALNELMEKMHKFDQLAQMPGKDKDWQKKNLPAFAFMLAKTMANIDTQVPLFMLLFV